jgi:hypothetical protein
VAKIVNPTTAVQEALNGIIGRYELVRNYPNPFNYDRFFTASLSPYDVEIVRSLGKRNRQIAVLAGISFKLK